MSHRGLGRDRARSNINAAGRAVWCRALSNGLEESRVRLSDAQGRTTISFLTDLTPFTPRAMLSAKVFSVVFLAKPDSITTPLRVSTLMLDAATCVLLTKRALIWVVIVVSST